VNITSQNETKLIQAIALTENAAKDILAIDMKDFENSLKKIEGISQSLEFQPVISPEKLKLLKAGTEIFRAIVDAMTQVKLSVKTKEFASWEVLLDYIDTFYDAIDNPYTKDWEIKYWAKTIDKTFRFTFVDNLGNHLEGTVERENQSRVLRERLAGEWEKLTKTEAYSEITTHRIDEEKALDEKEKRAIETRRKEFEQLQAGRDPNVQQKTS